MQRVRGTAPIEITHTPCWQNLSCRALTVSSKWPVERGLSRAESTKGWDLILALILVSWGAPHSSAGCCIWKALYVPCCFWWVLFFLCFFIYSLIILRNQASRVSPFVLIPLDAEHIYAHTVKLFRHTDAAGLCPINQNGRFFWHKWKFRVTTWNPVQPLRVYTSVPEIRLWPTDSWSFL